jgi:hypothetical protein
MNRSKPHRDAVAAVRASHRRTLLIWAWALPLIAATVLMLLTPSTASAQKLYRCGNNFSQVPCDKVTEGTPMAAAAAPEATRDAKKGTDVCAQAAISQLGSDQIGTLESSKAGPAAVIRYLDQPMVTRTQRVTLMVRTTDGVRLGQRGFTCNLSEDEQRVLQIR